MEVLSEVHAAGSRPLVTTVKALDAHPSDHIRDLKSAKQRHIIVTGATGAWADAIRREHVTPVPAVRLGDAYPWGATIGADINPGAIHAARALLDDVIWAVKAETDAPGGTLAAADTSLLVEMFGGRTSPAQAFTQAADYANRIDPDGPTAGLGSALTHVAAKLREQGLTARPDGPVFDLRRFTTLAFILSENDINHLRTQPDTWEGVAARYRARALLCHLAHAARTQWETPAHITLDTSAAPHLTRCAPLAVQWAPLTDPDLAAFAKDLLIPLDPTPALDEDDTTWHLVTTHIAGLRNHPKGR